MTFEIRTEEWFEAEKGLEFLFCGAISLPDLGGQRDQYPIGVFMFFGCFWRNMRPRCTLHMSVTSVMCPPAYGSASTSGDIRAFSRVSMTLNSSLLSNANLTRCYFLNCWFRIERITSKVRYNVLWAFCKPKGIRVKRFKPRYNVKAVSSLLPYSISIHQ